MKRFSRVLLAAALLTVPAAASAQNTVILVPSVSVSSVFDDNLFATTVGSGDQMTQLTPGIQALLVTPVTTTQGAYSFDAQRSIDHPALNNFAARQHALFSTRHRQTAKLTMAVDGTYDSTDTPSELDFATGIIL